MSANEFGDNLTVYIQATSGRFIRAGLPLATGEAPIWVTAADLDGDGDLDLVSANRVGEDLTLFFNGK